ncbi:MAG: NAD(P)/FAD-dependent oxidoreductase [Armatimonadota bacterium]
MKQTALIIGAGPAGLTAAYELLDKTDIHPIVLEASGEIGGISRTARYRGNRMDIGGHRFFSKSDRVMDWWLNVFPLQGAPSSDDRLLDRQIELATTASCRPLRGEAETRPAPDPETQDEVMLVRSRLSRILFLRKFFDYPVSLSKTTISNLGMARMMKIGAGYFATRLFPIRNETTLEHFFVNRFGWELYRTFFKDYTEKVWGVSCREIPADWGAQRVKGLSLSKAILHALKGMAPKKTGIEQKETETSLIESFLYPKYGPGQLWETVARQVHEAGADIRMHTRAVGLIADDHRIAGAAIENAKGELETIRADYVLSTMPVRDLIEAMQDIAPGPVRDVAQGLQYRDFITVGVLLKRLKLKNLTDRKTVNDIVPDNWIYIQEPDVKVGRLQIFNNWSPYMVADPDTVWIGMEYFCTEGDEMWRTADEDFTRLALEELAAIGVADAGDVLDTTVIRVQKAYPAYFGTYKDFDRVREFTDGFENLFLIGRNGMHRYNNMDHSMLTAMSAVENIIAGVKEKDNLWAVNAEEAYHETKS